MSFDPVLYLTYGVIPEEREDIDEALRMLAAKLSGLARHAAASGFTPVISLLAPEEGAGAACGVAAGLSDWSLSEGGRADLVREPFFLFLAFRGGRCERVDGPFRTLPQAFAHAAPLARLDQVSWRQETGDLWSVDIVNYDDSRMTYQIQRVG